MMKNYRVCNTWVLCITCIVLQLTTGGQSGAGLSGLKQWNFLLAPGYFYYHYNIMQLMGTNICGYTYMCINNEFSVKCAETFT